MNFLNVLGLRIAERIAREGKGCLIVVKKWDNIPNKNEQDVREKVRVLDWAPIVYSTAIAGHNVEKYVQLNHIFCFITHSPVAFFT